MRQKLAAEELLERTDAAAAAAEVETSSASKRRRQEIRSGGVDAAVDVQRGCFDWDCSQEGARSRGGSGGGDQGHEGHQEGTGSQHSYEGGEREEGMHRQPVAEEDGDVDCDIAFAAGVKEDCRLQESSARLHPGHRATQTTDFSAAATISNEELDGCHAPQGLGL